MWYLVHDTPSTAFQKFSQSKAELVLLSSEHIGPYPWNNPNPCIHSSLLTTSESLLSKLKFH